MFYRIFRFSGSKNQEAWLLHFFDRTRLRMLVEIATGNLRSFVIRDYTKINKKKTIVQINASLDIEICSYQIPINIYTVVNCRTNGKYHTSTLLQEHYVITGEPGK